MISAEQEQPTPASVPSPPREQRQRYRIRFRKTGMLRFISHNDLLRTWDRLLRRTGLPLHFTQGFHAKPKMSSPLALALGLIGADEVLDIELTDAFALEEVSNRINAEVVEGLEIVSVELLPHGGRGSTAVAVEYACRFENGIEGGFDVARVREQCDQLVASETRVVERRIPGKPVRRIDVRSKLENIVVEADEVRFRLRIDGGATVRPEELLSAIGLADAVLAGQVTIVRTRVELG